MPSNRIQDFGPRARQFVSRFCLLTILCGVVGAVQAATTRSPQELAFSPDGRWLAAADPTVGEVSIIALESRSVARQIQTGGKPWGVVWLADGHSLAVADYENGQILTIDAANGRMLRRLAASARPTSLAYLRGRDVLLAGSAAFNQITMVDLRERKSNVLVPSDRTPFCLAASADERLLVAGGFLPAVSALDPSASASVTLTDLDGHEKTAKIRLPAGSTMIRQVVISPDRRWAYAIHALARFTLPLTQVERGWMNGNAVSILDLSNRTCYATVLLDQLSNGAADPWGAALSGDGGVLWVALAGVHELARLDVSLLHRYLGGQTTNSQGEPLRGIWPELQKNSTRRGLLAHDLDAMTQGGVLTRYRLPGQGPRGIALSPDGKVLAIAAYFSGKILLVNPRNGKSLGAVALGPEPAYDQVRQGEAIFHDATFSLQHWQSCATCHPDGRVDGLNWDLLNDGIGNTKNTRSLLWAHKTPPVMSLGIRANMETAVTSGFRVSLFCQPKEEELEAVRAYLRSLSPEKSPYRLSDGGLTPKARKGREIFDSPRAGCSGCHPEPLFTDLQLHEVGTMLESETEAPLDTPTLVELWRTAPYLHHGGAVNLLEVLTQFNPRQLHGSTAHLSGEDREALVEYLLSL